MRSSSDPRRRPERCQDKREGKGPPSGVTLWKSEDPGNCTTKNREEDGGDT